MKSFLKTTALLVLGAFLGSGTAITGLLILKPLAGKWPARVAHSRFVTSAWRFFEEGDLEDAFELAKEGSPEHAQNQYIMAKKREQESNFRSAAGLYAKSAAQGYVPAMWELACCYRDGRGIGHDGKLAVYWAERAAEAGHVTACLMVARAYANGQLVPRSASKANRWWLRAANQGNAEAQYSLACAYENGCGVNRDIDDAAKWFGRAKANGYPEATAGLARMKRAKRVESWNRFKERLSLLFT